MNIWREIVEWLNPCIHQWDVIETLKDKPKNPRKLTIISRCAICGILKTDNYEAPGAAPTCPPHKWITKSITQVFSGTEKTEKNAIPIARTYLKECTQCGELDSYRVDYDRKS